MVYKKTFTALICWISHARPDHPQGLGRTNRLRAACGPMGVKGFWGLLLPPISLSRIVNRICTPILLMYCYYYTVLLLLAMIPVF